MGNNSMGLTNDEILRYWKYISIGIEVGQKQLADHIAHQLKIGNPTEINGAHGFTKFIVPIKKHSFNNEEIVREVIIQTETPERARIIAIGDFQHDGWFVDMDCENYRQFKE